MAQEFFINSQTLEDKVRQILPSQGGAGAGFDLSASTQIIPIIDLTESAEGSTLRQDLQSSFSYSTLNFVQTNGGSNTIINSTGYWRVFGNVSIASANPSPNGKFVLANSGTPKTLLAFDGAIATTSHILTQIPFDFIVKLEAGDTLENESSSATGCLIFTAYKQLASIDGTLN